MNHDPSAAAAAAAADDAFVAGLLPAFIEEAQEQVSDFEHLLLQLEDAPDDQDLLGALFRCAHTIKGAAGVVGLDRIVAFTHHVESLLDNLRDGLLRLTPDLSTLLLQCNDATRALVAAGPDGDSAAAAQGRDALVVRLQAFAAPAAGQAPTAAAAPAATGAADGEARFQVAVRFGLDTFRNGLDPLTMLRFVGGMGRCHGLRFDRDAVPPLDALDPESCHLALAFAIDTPAPRSDIERAFEFIAHYSDVSVTDDAPAAAAPAEAAPNQETEAPAADSLAADAAGGTPAAAPAPAAGTAPAAGAASGAPAGGDGGFIRVHAHRLDEVINLLGELVIAGAGASLLARRSQQRALVESTQQITRLIEGIRNSTLKLRMVPIGETFSRFRRVVRDTAAELGKDVALELVGGETELDKAVVERIADPLMHLVRNALDHGLETPEQRLAAGKPAQGRLTLSACHESGSILIRIDDDGRGIQRRKVLERAWQRGLLEPGQVPATDNEVLRLIFEPGFSTAEKVTNLSGRGVGMDVVRRNIEALRGSVTIDSVEGQGSSIEIRLPLTLAIIDGFLVGVGSSRFIFPLESVVEVIASRVDDTRFDAQGRGCVDLRGRLLPVVDLRRLYALDSRPPERSSVVVVRIGPVRYGVLVDALLGQHQTVIKPLGRLLRGMRGIAGSSILGTGEVALIFDVDALGQLAAADPHRPTRPTRTEAAPAATLTASGDR